MEPVTARPLPRPGATLLVLLLAADALLVGAHLSMKYLGEPREYVYDLGVDRGLGEFAQYAKSLAAVVLLVMLWRRARAGVLLAWALVCLYLLADDFLGLHERAGHAARGRFPAAGEAAVHLGELAWLGACGLVLVLVVALTHRRAGSEVRRVSAVLVGLFGVLVVLGVGVDAVHHLLLPHAALDAPFTALEDGGELVALSCVVAFLFAVVHGERARPGRRLGRLVGPEAADTSDDDEGSLEREPSVVHPHGLEP